MLTNNNDNNKIDINFIKNKHRFTDRHIDVISCLMRGKFSNKTIAQVLKVSPKTVDSHIQMVMQKLDINIREKIIEFMQASSYENALREHYNTLTGINHQTISSNDTPFQVTITRKNKNKNKFIFILIIFISLIMINFAKRFLSLKMFFHNIALHPNAQCFLERHHIIQKMHDTLVKQKKPIKIIAIKGIGGAGKTTLARQYTKRYPSSIVWEINAETPETMSSSFFELADQLAKTEEEKSTLIHIKNMDNQKERDLQIIQFIKGKLQSHKNWLLVYDNVNSSTKTPLLEDCGQGTIIITTRDANLNTTGDIISVSALTEDEKYNLFKKITPVLAKQKKEVVSFLKNLPPFPFDVATAAYYIKATKISYPNFIKHMKDQDATFETTVLKVRQSMNNYIHTRHSLLTLKFRSLVKEHPEFKELLLALALFDSQRIPRAFLNDYKKSTVVDLFIHALQKYSLLTTYDSNSISLHRSTQEHLALFLTEESKDILTRTEYLINALKDHLSIPIQKINTPLLRSFIPHLLSFLKHDKLLTPQSQLTLRLLLGQIYFSFNDYPESKKYLDNVSKIMASDKIPHSLKAESLSYLGALYKSISDYPQAEKYFTEALSLYKNSKDQDIEKAFLLINFGHSYMYLGDYQNAEKLMSEALDIYKRKLENDHPRLAMSYIYLGNLYERKVDYVSANINYELACDICKKAYGPTHTITVLAQVSLGDLYNNLGKYKMAIKIIEKSAHIYKKHLSSEKDRWAWCLVYLGRAYSSAGMTNLANNILTESSHMLIKQNNKLRIAWGNVSLAEAKLDKGEYQEAISLLENSFNTFETTYPDRNHIRFAWVCHYLGNAYKLSNNYDKALQSYTRSLNIYKEKYGEQNIETAMVKADFGDFYRSTNQFDQSESMLNDALSIFEKNKHPQVYKCLEYLGDLYIAQSNLKEAKIYYKKALEIAKMNFPKGSDHTKRLQKKLAS